MATPPSNQHNSQSTPPPLTPTTERIIRECPKARILIVGRSGVGKSSLVNAIFKTSFALVRHDKAGEADINHEHISAHNERFVLHDSQGYEPGDDRKFQILENFIKMKTHSGIPVSERLHAIWLCLPVSFAGTRFERGDERIFQLNRGKVPIIVVFTQFDLLAAQVLWSNRGAARGDEIKKRAEEIFEEKNVAPFKKITRAIPGDIPFVAVSIRQPDTLQNLVQITTRNIQLEIPMSWEASQGSPTDETKRTPFFSMFKPKRRGTVSAATEDAESVRNLAMFPAYNAGENSNNRQADWLDLSDSAQVVLSMAQRVNLPDKISASINVGKKKYWTAIASGIHFLNIRLSNCLEVIHTDIIKVWNIRGMDEYFLAESFRGRMTVVVQDLSNRRDDNRPGQAALAIASAVAGITAAVAPAIIAAPGGVIAAPVAAVVFVAAWAYGIYRKTPDTICCLMAYVVDLIIVMRAVFQASCEDKDGIIQRHRVEQIIERYDGSATKREVHHTIRGFVQAQFPFTRSTVVEKIEALIKEDRNFTR